MKAKSQAAASLTSPAYLRGIETIESVIPFGMFFGVSSLPKRN